MKECFSLRKYSLGNARALTLIPTFSLREKEQAPTPKPLPHCALLVGEGKTYPHPPTPCSHFVEEGGKRFPPP